MKDPEKAAALLVFPLIFAILGMVFSIRNATIINVSINSQTFTSGLGNLYMSTATGPNAPLPLGVKIVGACPGEDSCVLGSGAAPDKVCVPSSVWSLIIVNQFFASVAIILQAAMAAALCARRGTRVIHQLLGASVIFLLIIAFASLCGVPARFYKVCSTIPSDVNGVSVTYALDFGGQLPFLPDCPAPLALSYTLFSCSRLPPRLLAFSNRKPCGKPPAAGCLLHRAKRASCAGCLVRSRHVVFCPVTQRRAVITRLFYQSRIPVEAL